MGSRGHREGDDGQETPGVCSEHMGDKVSLCDTTEELGTKKGKGNGSACPEPCPALLDVPAACTVPDTGRSWQEDVRASKETLTPALPWC